MIRPETLCRELYALLEPLGLLPAKVTFTAALDQEHARNCRRYAQVEPEGLVFEFARAILDLGPKHRLGLLAHEVGHCLAHRVLGPEHSEDEADQCALGALGLRIRYDHKWPGKGLQIV